tara:strand:+ start:875 stop:1195 length:321 start_codon:yes stop_codon:yes gene_type:complete
LVFKSPLPIRLKSARTKAGLSQRELGIRIGLEPSSASSRMNHYEKGRHTPDLHTIKRIAEELNLPLCFFFCEEDDIANLVVYIHNLPRQEREALVESVTSLRPTQE